MQEIFFYKRFSDRLFHKYRRTFFKPYKQNPQISKYNFDIHINDLEADLWYGKYKYEFAVWAELEFDVIIRNVRPDDSIFDIGCHQGIWLLLFSSLAQNGKVVGFDTSSYNLSVAKSNLDLNDARNVTVENVCASNVNDFIQVATHSSGVDKYLTNKSIPTVQLRSRRLDEYSAENNIHATVVKIDVEGYEEEVLQGMTNIFNSKPKIFMELDNFKFEDKQAYVTNILKLIPH